MPVLTVRDFPKSVWWIQGVLVSFVIVNQVGKSRGVIKQFDWTNMEIRCKKIIGEKVAIVGCLLGAWGAIQLFIMGICMRFRCLTFASDLDLPHKLENVTMSAFYKQMESQFNIVQPRSSSAFWSDTLITERHQLLSGLHPLPGALHFLLRPITPQQAVEDARRMPKDHMHLRRNALRLRKLQLPLRTALQEVVGGQHPSLLALKKSSRNYALFLLQVVVGTQVK